MPNPLLHFDGPGFEIDVLPLQAEHANPSTGRNADFDDQFVAIRQLREELGFTQQQFAVFLNTSLATIGRYEIDRTPGGPMLRRLQDLARERRRQDLASVLQRELKFQMLEWMGIGAAARQIYKRTVRPEVLVQARTKVAAILQQCDRFENAGYPQKHSESCARSGERQSISRRY